MGDALLNLTRQLCEFICALSPEQLGEANRTDLRYKTLDWLGCVIAAQNGDVAKRIKGYTLACGGRAQATAFGLPEKTSVGAFYDGILLNPADSGSFNLDVRLNDRIPNPDEPVQWSLDFDVLTPNFPINPAQLTITEDGDSRILTWDNMERDCLTAYQNGQILTDGLDSLFSYALYLPVPNGMTEDEWEQTDLENRLILSGAFDLSEQLHCNFITNGVRVASLTEPKTFSVGDYTCTLTRLDVTFAQLDYEMTVSHSGSSTAAKLFTATDRTLQFLLSVPEGDAILSFTDSSIEDDGTVSLSGNYILTQPISAVIFTPVFPDHLTNENEWMFEGYQPTEEEKAAAVTVDIE